ncbi:MAG: glycine oxidase ThiO [Acidobacteria bacterium]|nr:glycine oxidase ThiO [Acidobacteriota bacterium]
MHTSDVVIAGAGIIGLSLAMELRRAGASVTVLDRGEPAREASSAAAGMLVTQDPDTHPTLKPLAEAGAAMYPEFVEDIELRAEMNVGYENRGALYVAEEGEHLEVPALRAGEPRRLEPALADYPNVCLLREQSVDPRLLAEAAAKAAKQLGVTIHHESAVARVAMTPDHQLSVESRRRNYQTATFVNCAGAWAGEIAGAAVPARPRKGQMLAVVPQKLNLRRVVRSRKVYLLPRHDGRIIIGATVEDVGFDKTVKPATIQQLHQEAARLVPAIGEARILEAWAGLRPGSPDDLPIMGPCILPGTYVASGHFRNGILLAPITAVLMAELIQGKTSRLDLSPFAPSRFRTESSNPQLPATGSAC